MIYKTKDGDMLDAICHKYYGARPEAVEAVLEANAGLAKYRARLPAGIEINLIDLPQAQKPTISLWD